MATRRKEKTLADYLVIAIAPVLIMALVGSVSFFLLQIGYHGQWPGRMRWTLFWFVLATVLISRIGIEQGREYARIYGIALALAVVLLLQRLGGATLIVWLLLAFIWWCAGRLVWDCTLVDEDEDASGEGLLEFAGLDNSAVGRIGEEPASATKPSSWWERLKQIVTGRTGQTHAPGSWVLYFSLLALPAFGLGQAFIPAENSDRGFTLLGVYVAAALGLLLATSFLGLRRYLRQRNLQMPVSIAGVWMLLGTLLAGAIMIVCLLLPRPDGLKSLTAMVNQAVETHRQASQLAMVPGEAADGDGRRIGSGESGTTGDNRSGTEKKDGAPSDNSKASGQKGRPDQPGKGNAGGKSSSPGKKGQPGGGTKTGAPQQGSSPKTNETLSPGDLLKWLLYAVVLMVILYVVYRHRREVAAFLRELWVTLRQILASLFGRAPQPSEQETSGIHSSPGNQPKPFASFTNPFTSGDVAAVPPEELVKYTFAALEAWAAEHGVPRQQHDTPMEFARELAAREPRISGGAGDAALLYSRVAYAGNQPTREGLECLERLWTAMELTPIEAAATA